MLIINNTLYYYMPNLTVPFINYTMLCASCVLIIAVSIIVSHPPTCKLGTIAISVL